MVDSAARVRAGARQIKQVKDAGRSECLPFASPRTQTCADMARHPRVRGSWNQSSSYGVPVGIALIVIGIVVAGAAVLAFLAWFLGWDVDRATDPLRASASEAGDRSADGIAEFWD